MSHKIHNSPKEYRRPICVVFALVFVFVAVWFVVAQPLSETDTSSVTTNLSPTTNPSVSPPTVSPTPSPSLVLRVPKGCEVQATESFVPKTVSFEHLGVRKVLSLGLEKDGTVGTPPYDQPDKLAFNKVGSEPGSAKGMVAFTAHTFSKGTWLGNELLAKLKVGDTIIVSGQKKAERLCYVVDKKPSVYKPDASGSKDLPVFPVERVYGFDRPSEMSLTVCSDYDAKSKVWLLRTVWFARPI